MASRLDQARRLTLVSVATNLSLSIIKITAGLVGHSSLIIADGVDSLSDTFSTLLAYLGVRIASKKPDAVHPYGHERYEAVLGKILAVFLFIVSLGILYQAREEFISPQSNIPTLFPLVAAIISIVAKVFLSRYTIYHAKNMNSSIYLADGKNYQNDAFASAASLLGIFLARQGYPIFQPIFTVIISLFLFKIALDLYIESVAELSDVSAPDEILEAIREVTQNFHQIKRIDVLKSRRHGKRYYVDMEIAIEAQMSLFDAHAIAENLHNQIESSIPEIKHCMIHVNPS